MTGRQRRGGSARAGTDGGRGRRLGYAAIVAASAWALLAAAAAQASTVTVGSVLPTVFASTKFERVESLFNTALPEKGANLASPVTGAIVRWRIQGASGGPFRLRVLHPTGTGAFTALGTSAPQTPAGLGVEIFSTNIPIHTGDLIGIDSTNASDEIGIAAVPGASSAFIAPPPFEGSTLPPNESLSGKEIELSAEVQPAPAITSITPTSGSIKGGTTVTITGTSFTSTSAVKFGTVAATSFTVDSDTQITATAPAGVRPGKVDVNVTTLAGTSGTVKADGFTYTACVVPNLAGKKLAAAKVRLRQAGCKAGTVKKVRAAAKKRGKVVKQSPKAGNVLAPGSKVGLKVGR